MYSTYSMQNQYGHRKQKEGLQPQLPTRTLVSPSAIADVNGNLLTESTAILNRWTEYCSDQSNYPLWPYNCLFQNDPRSEADDDSPWLPKEEVEVEVRSLTAVNSPGVENVPYELIKHGGEV